MSFLRQLQSITTGHNTQLFAFTGNNAHFPCPNFFIDTQAFFANNRSPPKLNKKREQIILPALKIISDPVELLLQGEKRAASALLLGYNIIMLTLCQHIY